MTVAVYDGRGDEVHQAAGHPERPARPEAIRVALAREVPDLIEWRDADDASDEALLAVHTRAHLEGIAAMSAAGGGWFDPDTYCTAGSAAAARRAAGLAVAATDAALAGTPSFALTRPPGHHAGRETPMGFCLFNNVAVAAAHARRRGVSRVAILDIDVHHGNGTQEIFYDDPAVFYGSLHQWPFYPGTGAPGERGTGAGEGTTLNLPQAAGSPASAWWHDFSEELMPAVAAFAPELVLVSAGFDAHADDPLAELRLDVATYADAAAMIAASGAGATVWCLEGGYSLDALAQSAVACVRALADGERPHRDG